MAKGNASLVRFVLTVAGLAAGTGVLGQVSRTPGASQVSPETPLPAASQESQVAERQSFAPQTSSSYPRGDRYEYEDDDRYERDDDWDEDEAGKDRITAFISPGSSQSAAGDTQKDGGLPVLRTQRS